MLFFKKAIVEEAMPPIPPTVYAASLTFVRDVAFSACSYIPQAVVDAAMDTKVAVARLLDDLVSSIPRSIEDAKVSACDVATSIGSNIPDDLKSIIGANDFAGGTICLVMLLLLTLLMLSFLHFVFTVPSYTTYDSRHITKEDSKNNVNDEGSSTAPFSGSSSSGSIGSSLGDDASAPRDEVDAPGSDDDEEDHVDSSAPSVICSPPVYEVDAAEPDAQRAGPPLKHASTLPSVDPNGASTRGDDDDAPARCDGGDDDDDLSDLSVTPSFEELIKIQHDNDGGGPSPLKTPDREQMAASAAASVVSGSSDDEGGSSGGGVSSGPTSSTPPRTGGSKVSQTLRRGLSSVSLKSLGGPLGMSSRKLVSK